MEFKRKRFRIKGFNPENVNNWLHHSENGQSIMSLLFKLKKGYVCKVDIAELQRIDSSINSDDGSYLKSALKDYFDTYGYPFEIKYSRKDPSSLYIKAKRPLYCTTCKVPLETESIFKKHQKCSPHISKIEQEEHIDNIFIDGTNRETEDKLRKKIKEELSVKDSWTIGS